MTIKQFPLLTVGALVKSPQDNILIVQTTKWRGTWGVPGGKVEWGESMETAVMRELKEEVNLDIFNIRFALLQEALIDEQFYQPSHFALVNYFAETAHEQVVPNEEIVQWAWVKPPQAFEYPLNTFTQKLVKYFIAD